MKVRGIRILDKSDHIVIVELPDILEEIAYGATLNWSILYMEAMGHLEEGRSIPEFEEKIRKSEKGLFISWKDLNILSKRLYDIMHIIVIGCKDQSLLRRYDKDQEMYETCDIVIEMVDSNYWELFSKDESLLKSLDKKFKDVKFLESDFDK